MSNHALAPFAMALRARHWLALLLGASLTLVQAQPEASASEAAEREQLNITRNDIETRFQGRLRECESRFFVTDCVERARKERRAALAPLDARLAKLDEMDRMRRAQENRERLAGRQAKRSLDMQQAASEPIAAVREPKPLREGIDLTPRAVTSKPTLSDAERKVAEQEARAAYQRKQEEAAAHRAEIERRNVEAKKPPAAPLPPLTK